MLSYFIICLQFWLDSSNQKLAKPTYENITEIILAQNLSEICLHYNKQ